MRSTAGSRDVASKRMLRRYLTTGKVGEMLEVSPAAIKKWIQQGKLAAFRTPGGHFRILADEFERFQKTHGFGAGAGEPRGGSWSTIRARGPRRWSRRCAHTTPQPGWKPRR